MPSPHPAAPAIAFNAMVLRWPFSGVEVAVYELARALAGQAACRLDLHFPATLDPPANAPGVRGHPHPIPFSARGLRIAWEQLLLPLYLRRHRNALLHAPAYVAPLAAPCPTILTLYDLHVFSHPRLCRSLNRLHYRALIPRCVRRAAAVIVPSHHTRRVLARTLGEAAAAKAVVIPLGVAEPFTPVHDPQRLAEARRRLALPARYLLFVGNPDPRKNLPVVYETWHCLRKARPEIGLVVAGRDHAPATNAPPRARCLGYVDTADLPVLYSLAEALVYPSIDEGYGLPAIEAMACGCPVVCTHEAPAEISPAAVLRVAADPAVIAERIEHLMSCPGERDERVRAGRAAAAQRTWTTVARQTLELYAQVLSQLPDGAGHGSILSCPPTSSPAPPD